MVDVEGIIWRPARSVLRDDGDKIAVVRERQTLEVLADVECMDDTRDFPFEVDHVNRHDIAGVGRLDADPLIADNGNIALGTDLDCVGPEAAGHYAFGIFDLVAVAAKQPAVEDLDI